MKRHPLWILIICLLWEACQTSSTKKEQINENQDSTKINWQKYVEGLNEQIKKNPNNANTYYERAMAYYRTNDSARTWNDIQQAVLLDSTQADYFYFRGFCQYVWQHNDFGMADFQKAVELKSDNPETYYQIGNIYMLQNKPKESLKWYDLAIQRDSLDPAYPFAKGFAYDKLNQLPAAKQNYEHSLTLDSLYSKTIGAYFELLLYKEKNFQQGLALNKRLLRQNPNHPLGKYNVGNYYLWEALRTPNSKSHERETFVRLSIDEYETAIMADTNFTKAFYQRGYAFFMLQEFNQALLDFRRVSQLDPKDERAYFMQASIYEHFQDYSQALSLYEKALQLKPNWKDAQEAAQELRQR
ncbi:MAG: tetratricopeptide repeat protein [Bacteroidia bacterium]|nr:tetratricopeptide repeat protein [Bacteroidia bacterium]